jgi:hypothetical protein
MILLLLTHSSTTLNTRCTSRYGLWQTCAALWQAQAGNRLSLRADVAAARTATLGYTLAVLCIALDRNLATMMLGRCAPLQGGRCFARCNSRERGTRRYAIFALKTAVNVVMLPLLYSSVVGSEWLRTVVLEPFAEVVGGGDGGGGDGSGKGGPSQQQQRNVVEILAAGMFAAAFTVACLEASRSMGLEPPRGTPRKEKVDEDVADEPDDDFIVSSRDGPWNPTQLEYRSGTYSALLVLCKFVHMCVVAPFAEELFYRMFIVTRVAKTHIHLAHMDLTLDNGEGHWIPAVLIGAVLFGCGERNFALGPAAGVVWGVVQSLVLRQHGIGAAMLAHATRSACVGVYVMARKEWVLWSPSV